MGHGGGFSFVSPHSLFQRFDQKRTKITRRNDLVQRADAKRAMHAMHGVELIGQRAQFLRTNQVEKLIKACA